MDIISKIFRNRRTLNDKSVNKFSEKKRNTI